MKRDKLGRFRPLRVGKKGETMSTEKKQSIWLALAAIAAVTGIMAIYALQGKDGVMFAAFAVAIGAIVGVPIGRRLGK